MGEERERVTHKRSKKAPKVTRFLGEIESSLIMIKKLANSQKKAPKRRSLNDCLVKIQDLSMGQSLRCFECGAFFKSTEFRDRHFSKDHSELWRHLKYPAEWWFFIEVRLRVR